MPAEEKDEPLNKHRESEEELVSGIESEKVGDEAVGESPATESPPEASGADSWPSPRQRTRAPRSLKASSCRCWRRISPATSRFSSRLPERLLIVEEQEGDSDLGVFADVVESRLRGSLSGARVACGRAPLRRGGKRDRDDRAARARRRGAGRLRSSGRSAHCRSRRRRPRALPARSWSRFWRSRRPACSGSRMSTSRSGRSRWNCSSQLPCNLSP